MGLLAILGLVLLLAKSSLETPSEYHENVILSSITSPRKIHKRKVSVPIDKDVYAAANEFIEEKLVEHGQALEHLVILVQKNEELTRKLVERLSNKKNADKPDLPEKVELSSDLSGRRSLVEDDLSPAVRGEKGNPWCVAAFLCHKSGDSVCGLDSSYGYGKFKDICHMFEVNCYWEYNFLLSPACHKVV